MSAPAIDLWERRLDRENLGDLDYDDGAGGIKVGNRGSGKVLNESRYRARAASEAERDQRRAMVAKALHGRRFRRVERRVLTLYASGLGTRIIPRITGVGRMTVHRLIRRVKREHKMAPRQSFAELLSACEPSTIVLFFALLERALTEPGTVKALIGQARAVPEIRQLLEPDEVSDAG